MLRKGVDWLLYSNLWIALNALAQAAQTQYLLGGNIRLNPGLGLVFFGTLFLYALHRAIGLQRLRAFADKGRYYAISQFATQIRVFALLGLAGAAACYLLLPWPVQWRLALPGLVALAYVAPLGASGKRLRDLHFLKIFLIAGVWAWLTVWLPAAGHGPFPWRMALERAAFIFAITLPFDIRDLRIDNHTQVKTLPAVMGVRAAIALALALLAIMLVFVWTNPGYNGGVKIALSLSALASGALILFSGRAQHDYYFTGLMDGMMILQMGLVWLAPFAAYAY